MPTRKTVPPSSIVRSPGADILERVIGIAPAPLLPGEAEADYVGVAMRLVAVAQPKDAIEEFLTRDVIDLTWEILRLRRAKAGLWRTAAGKGVRRILSTIGKKPFIEVLSQPDLANEWAAGNATARRQFAEMLGKADLTMNDVMAEALAKEIEAFERLDRILASLEARRNNALREIGRHREALGAAIRQAVDDVQDAEFQDVETGTTGGGTPP
jgi:hypothetical protein